VQHQPQNESNEYQIMRDLLDRPQALDVLPPVGSTHYAAIWHVIVQPILDSLEITVSVLYDYNEYLFLPK
jgi:hypothetical protein